MEKIPLTELRKLASALELLRKEHIQGSLAVNADGIDCYPDDPDAVSFCAMGAFQRVGVKDETIIRFAEHLVLHSTIARAAGYDLEGVDGARCVDDIEDIIFEVNDHEPRGRGAIRKALVRFVHANVEKENVLQNKQEG